MRYVLTLGTRICSTGEMLAPNILDFAEKREAKRFAIRTIKDTQADKETWCSIDDSRATNDVIILFEAGGNLNGMTVMVDKINNDL